MIAFYTRPAFSRRLFEDRGVVPVLAHTAPTSAPVAPAGSTGHTVPHSPNPRQSWADVCQMPGSNGGMEYGYALTSTDGRDQISDRRPNLSTAASDFLKGRIQCP